MKEFEKGITERKRWLALAYKENLRNEEKMRRNEVNSHWSYLNKLGVWCFFIDTSEAIKLRNDMWQS